jgi:hypothetical protein
VMTTPDEGRDWMCAVTRAETVSEAAQFMCNFCTKGGGPLQGLLVVRLGHAAMIYD